MADAKQIVRWQKTESVLRAALDDARSTIDPDEAAWVAELLDHNELGVAMDALVDAALASRASDLPAVLVENLRSASAAMGGYRPANWDEFAARFAST